MALSIKRPAPKPIAPKQTTSKAKSTTSAKTSKATEAAKKPAKFDTTKAAYTLMSAFGGSSTRALGKVIAARGGDPGSFATPAQQKSALQDVQKALGMSSPPTKENLRDLDHFLNTYRAVHSDSFAPAKDDGFLKSTAKTLGRTVNGVGVGVVTVGYSAAKAVAQKTGFDPIKLIPGQKFTGNDKATSAPSLSEVAQGLKGAFYGVYDKGVDKE